MKVNEKLSVLFFLSRKRENPVTGLAPIYIRITINEDRKEFSSGQQCLATDWCNKKKSVTAKTLEARAVNNELTEIKATLVKLYDVLELQGKTVSSDMLREEYRKSKGLIAKKPQHTTSVSCSSDHTAASIVGSKQGRSVAITASDFDIRKTVLSLSERAKELDLEKRKLDKFKHELVKAHRVAQYEKNRDQLQADIEKATLKAAIHFESIDISKVALLDLSFEILLYYLRRAVAGTCAFSTFRRHCATHEKIQAFNWYRFKDVDLPASSIKIKYAKEIYEYMTIVDVCDNNAAMKHIKLIKQVYDRAVENGYQLINPLHKFKCTYIEPEPAALEMEDILKLINTDFGEPLNEKRDAFIFSCFTGYAYEEVRRFTYDDIYTGLDGKKWLRIARTKTVNTGGFTERVPLLPIAVDIIERYNNHPCRLVSNKLLPIASNQAYNSDLKIIARTCGIALDLTTHDARHTFATTITLENDVPLSTVSKMLGHKSIRTTERYAKVTKRKISKNMSSVEKLLFDDGKLRM